MGGAALQMQLQLALLRLGNDHRAIGQRHARTAYSTRLRDKYAMPLRPAGRHVVHVQHHLREPLVEHAWLHLKGDLRADQLRFRRMECAQRCRPHPRSHDERKQAPHKRQHADRKKDSPTADPQRRQRNNFAVCRHPPQPQQYANQSGHRQRENKYTWKNTKEQLQNLRARTYMAHVNLHQPYEPRHEKHECEDDQSEECVARYLADNIAIQNTHDANAQCTTLSARLRFSPRNRRAIYRVVANSVIRSLIGYSCLYTLNLSMPIATDHLREPRLGTPAE